ncbi:MAG: citrate synthase [Pseudomonadota bacterium]
MSERDNYVLELGERARRNNQLQPGSFSRFGVKHGLRNEDGSGVLVGLTTIAGVFGYEMRQTLIPTEGRLYYRGIDLNDIIRRYDATTRFAFEEVVYLLLFGEFPRPEELSRFTGALAELRALPRNFVRDVLQAFPTPNIMNGLARSILTLYSADPDPERLAMDNQVRQAMEVVARMPTLVAYAYHVMETTRRGKGLILLEPDPELSSAENFLRLLRPGGTYTETEARTLDRCLVLHADHGGGNNSTFTARVVTSTMSDIYSAIAASIGSLKGPLHGGQNARIVELMDDLKEEVPAPRSLEGIRTYLFRLLQGEAFDGHGRVYGMGHAVYTLSDPRSILLKRYAEELAREKESLDEFDLWATVEEETQTVLRELKRDDHLLICANIDFYAAFVYKLLDLPREVFTPLFAIGRAPGWCAHRLEMMSNPMKVMRPSFKVVCPGCVPEEGRCETCVYSKHTI